MGVERSSKVVVGLRAIAYNIPEIRKKIGDRRDLMAVVKADGYGHGAAEVSLSALKREANCLGVTLSVDEIAGKIETINYKVVCAVGKRIPRIYIV